VWVVAVVDLARRLQRFRILRWMSRKENHEFHENTRRAKREERKSREENINKSPARDTSNKIIFFD
jgi:hypothetical protein